MCIRDSFWDLYYFYHLLEFGKGRAFNKVVGVYRLHEGGVYSSLETEKKLRTSINIFKNIKNINKDSRANIQIISDLDNLINKYYYSKEFVNPLFNINLYRTIFERFSISMDFKKLVNQSLKVFKYTFR